MSGARGSGRGPRGGGAAGARGGRTGPSAAAATPIRGPGTAPSTIRGPPTTTTTSSSSHAGPSKPTPPLSGPSSSRSTPVASSTTNYSGATTGVIGHKDKSGRIVDLVASDDRCPNCKTDRYLNPRLKLLVSPCYHKLCTSCIDRIWSLGPAPCPQCGHVCRKSQFGAQTFSDLDVEREVDVRKRVGRLFASRSQEDFETLKGYNDWLEEAERLTFNLVNRIDVEETNAQLAKYEGEMKRNLAAAKNGGGSNGSAAAGDGALLESLESRLSSLRQSRVARRKAHDVEDAALKKQQEDAIVAALEDGSEEDELEAIQNQWRENRAQLEARREEEEARDVVQEEELRREIADAQSGAGRRITTGQGKGGAGADRTEWKADSLLQFSGPMATLAAGDELLQHAVGKLHPPAELLESSPTRAGEVQAVWTPYDPWIEPFLSHLHEEEGGAKLGPFKAGGYDVAEWWRAQMRAGVATLGVSVDAKAGATSA
ncbi:CDK-activating kinase assembly factor [Jaminaea rosea]|uniref:RNA polymerase II transcription factor B subunit 3 n=1 Tax=Jaminaea rosea TaxID=1569628 RepID=A0A316URE1_9BASI|nr:CDK-activating kinase assembly factor [Jaminaea rosea]PWN27879.1 CDK-activating kinase assembly factor [Jaminaea rosea]